MENRTTIENLPEMEPTEMLESVWSSTDISLAEKARTFSKLHMQSRLTLEGSARMTGATPAQIQALLELATLEDDDLERVSRLDPPAITWFLFASAETETIQAGLEALMGLSDKSEHVLLKVYEAMRSASGLTQDERIAMISGPTLGHLAKKAKQYDKLAKNARSLLVSVAQRRNKGELPTEKQLSWLKSILLELVQAGVISRDSKDNDQEMCNEVLDALGV